MTVYSDCLKKALASAFFICFCGCSSSTSHWQRDSVVATQPDSCAILSLSPQQAHRNLEIVLHNQKGAVILFLNAYGMPFTPNEEGTVTVSMNIDESTATYQGRALQGNQRLILPQEAQTRLLEALKAHAVIYITAGRYTTEINYEGFDKAYEAFINE